MTNTVELGGSQQVTKRTRYIPIGSLEATLCDKCIEELIRRSRQSTVRIFWVLIAVVGLCALAAISSNDLIGSIAAIVGCVSVVLLFGTLKTLWEVRKVSDSEARKEAFDSYVWPIKLGSEMKARRSEDPHHLFHPNIISDKDWLGELLSNEPGKKVYQTEVGVATYRYKVGFENEPSWLASIS